jgi:hypothetical protein
MDGYDALALLGLGMLGTGLWLVSPALSLSVAGGLLLAAGILGSMWRARRKRG